MNEQALSEKYEAVIGLEIHAELKTKTKLFCRCSAAFGAAPNAHTCPICLGLPGTMPQLSEEALRLSVRACFVTGCTVSEQVHFDRKHYYYPDLPKGYQITQKDTPLGTGGALCIKTAAGQRTVRLERLHVEEDAGKLIHHPDKTLIDYNRSGIPLIEIVTQPDIHTEEEAMAFLYALRQRLLFAGVSDGKMNEGSLRCDINISLRRRGDTALGTRTEIKNVNSVQYAGRAIRREFFRQAAILEAGGKIMPETRRYDERLDETISLRTKETVADYRYMPEPDIPDILLPPDYVEAIRAELPPMPEAYGATFSEAGIPDGAIAVLTETPERAAFAETALRDCAYPAVLCHLLLEEVFPKGESLLPGEMLRAVATLLGERRITAAVARYLVSRALLGEDPLAVAERESLYTIADRETVSAFVRQAMAENPRAAEEVRRGNLRASGTLIGAAMKISGGRADGSLVREEILRQAEE